MSVDYKNVPLDTDNASIGGSGETLPTPASSVVRRESVSDVNTLTLTHSTVPLCFGAVSVEQQNQPSNKRKSTRYSWWSIVPMCFLY
jgi:hypothetical protein